MTSKVPPTAPAVAGAKATVNGLRRAAGNDRNLHDTMEWLAAALGRTGLR